MNDLLERLAERGAPAGAEVMIGRVEAELAGALPAAPSRSGRPLLAGAVAAAFVLAAVGGGAWLLSRSGSEPAPAALPTTEPAWPEFELWFEWLRPGMDPAASVEAAVARGRPVERFLFHSMGEWRMETLRAGTGLAGELEVRSGQAVHGGYRYDLGRAVEPPVPLEAEGMLPTSWFGELAPSLAWVRARPVEDSEPVAVPPSHPAAAFAAESDRMRMEFTEDGIPVLLESEEGPVYRAVRVERRPVPVSEIGAGLVDTAAAAGEQPAGRVVRRLEGDGFTVELVASGDCLDAVVRSEGSELGGPGGCGGLLGPDEALSSIGGMALPDGRWLAIYLGGPVTEFARVEVTHPDGSVFTGDVLDGYWLLAVPVDEPPDEVGLRAFDAAGLEVSAALVQTAPAGG